MSEIKGQLLGIVLVVAVFGIVSTLLVTSFEKTAKTVQSKIEDNTIPGSNQQSTITPTAFDQDGFQLLKY